MNETESGLTFEGDLKTGWKWQRWVEEVERESENVEEVVEEVVEMGGVDNDDGECQYPSQ